ncbi:MAG: DUF2959 domain-containing protein [Phycisphaerales bacterium]
MLRTTLRLLLVLISCTVLPACSGTMVDMKEAFGYAKREQLVDRVEDARDSQAAAKKQFDSALSEFLAVTQVSGGDLEAKYKKLNSAYEASVSKAATVTDRIKSVETVADKLFAEWQTELNQYSSSQLRAASERQLTDTRAQYQRLLGVMNNAESKMAPVLAAFKDQVLFLKHNLNARAIASLQGTADQINADVQRLIREMQASIDEADAFITQMKADK